MPPKKRASLSRATNKNRNVSLVDADLQKQTEYYPWDRARSSPALVAHCLEDDFSIWLSKKNKIQKDGTKQQQKKRDWPCGFQLADPQLQKLYGDHVLSHQNVLMYVHFIRFPLCFAHLRAAAQTSTRNWKPPSATSRA